MRDKGGINMSNIDFTGRVAIITGAGAGLGRDYALELAKRGAKVVVNDLGGAKDGSGEGSKAVADNVVAKIRALGGEALPNYDTVTTVEGGKNIVKTATDAFGKVDILINNAGILKDKSFPNMLEENWDTVLNVHLKGAYCVTRPAFIHMKQNGYGRIVMTSSASGAFGVFGQTNYASAKMGVAGLTNVLKLEGARHNIKVNVILPSAGTRLTADAMSPDMFEAFEAEYVTPAVLYLCSERCQDSGFYINAFGGYFSRSAILTGPGATFSEIPTPEQIEEYWHQITSMEDAKFYNDAKEMIASVYDFE